MRPRLIGLSLQGFKTIRDLSGFDPGNLTVLIGANGAGKSNLISFFRFLSWSLVPPGQLQAYVGLQGGASRMLHLGPTVTQQMVASLTLRTNQGRNEYAFRLSHAAGDTLVFLDESAQFRRTGDPRQARSLGSGHREAQLITAAEAGDRTARTILAMLRRIIVHQFHNTAATARMRNKWLISDNRWLKEDAANLAAFLYRLQNEWPVYYARITDTIRLILPFFSTFELYPEHDHVQLRWREAGSDMVFDASMASDGMLRAFALVALLQQPEDGLPDVLILDEPELGLHPYAIEIIASLIDVASHHVQVIVATQSVSLIDGFEPSDIVVVDRHGHESQYRRLDPYGLTEWLESYSLSELWEKNVLGGRPSR